jgi:zinc protease
MRNLAFDPQVIESERGVVYSERRSSVDNDTGGMLYEEVQALAFVAHPYQIPIVGWPSDIESWTVEDLKTYFRTYYAPNNCTLVFVGDVEPETVFALAERYFAGIPAQPEPPPVRTVEPEQQGERRVVLERPAQTPLLYLAYKSPAAADPRSRPLDLLLNVLAGGEHSRLHRLLVEDTQVAIAVSGTAQAGFDPGLSWFHITLPAGGDVARVERMVTEELARVVREGVTEAELARAKNIVIASFVRGLATIDGKANALGNFEVMDGDYRKLFEAPGAYEAVTRDDVKRIAAEVLDSRKRTVGVLIPQPEADAASEVVDAS